VADEASVAGRGAERRRLKRYTKRVNVRFETATLRGNGRVRNLHKEGMFVASHLLPAALERVRIVMELRDGRKIEIGGTVRWTSAQMPARAPATGFGVQLESPGQDYLDFFASLLFGG
jgi:hypothetical protein